MSNSYTSSDSHSYSESEIKEVLGKIYDDFYALDARGFDYFRDKAHFLKDIRDDLYFLLKKSALIEFQIQFSYGKENTAIHYKVNTFGSIVSNNKPSGGTDYYEFPKNANIGIVLTWKQGDLEVEQYLRRRNWISGGRFITGSIENKGDYSKGNLSVNRSIIR